MWSRLRNRLPFRPHPAPRSCRTELAVSRPGGAHGKPEEDGEAWGSLSLTWGATDHRFRSLFIKQQVIVARTLAPVTRATPVPANRGTNRVSRACV